MTDDWSFKYMKQELIGLFKSINKELICHLNQWMNSW